MQLLILVLATAAQPPTTHTGLQQGSVFSVAGCTTTVVGCYWDTDGRDGCLQNDASKNPASCPKPHGMRALPYNVAGCYQSAAGGLYVEKTSPPPPCVGSQMSNAYCAERCIKWAPTIPAFGDTFYAATQAGFACFCGTEGDGLKNIGRANEVAFGQCSDPCAEQTKGKSPAGTAGETCGGGWLNLVLKVECGMAWGSYVLLLLGLGSVIYIGGGIVRPAWAKRGLTPRQILRLHPHFRQWLELRALCSDGAAFARARAKGTTIPPPRIREELGEDTKDKEVKQHYHKAKFKKKSNETSSRRKEQKTHSDSGRSGGDGRAGGSGDGGGEGEGGSTVSEPLIGAGAKVEGTAAGGGGRWVRVK